MNVLLGLFLCTMFTRVFPASDPKAQSNRTEEPMETIVVQHKLDLGSVDSRLSNLETGMRELKSLILQLVQNGNGGNGSHQVGGEISSEINSTSENIVDSENENGVKKKNNDNKKSNVMGKEKKNCTLEDSRNFQVFEVERDRLHFGDAETWCEQKGGELAVLRSETDDCFLDPKYNTYMQGYGFPYGYYWVNHKSLPLNEPNWKSEGWPKNPHEYFRKRVYLCYKCGSLAGLSADLSVGLSVNKDGVFWKFSGDYQIGYICEFRSAIMKI